MTTLESVAEYAQKSAVIRSEDLADYIGEIDMKAIQGSYKNSFERFVFGDQNKKVPFSEFIAQCEDLITIVMTAHPTFFKSPEAAGALSKLFTARAMGESADTLRELEEKLGVALKDHPYKDPTTDQEGERLYAALDNTIAPARAVQLAMMEVAKEHYPRQWKEGHYSPFNRAIWQKFDRDGRDIPVNVQLGEAIRQRRMGFERVYLPRFRALLSMLDINHPERIQIQETVHQMQETLRIYKDKEAHLAALDENNIDMAALQNIVDDLQMTKEERITDPNVLLESLEPLLKGQADNIFKEAKMIISDLQSNGLCFSTPTHRVNAEDVHKFLNVERHKQGKSDLQNADNIKADTSHFQETEEMIEKAVNVVDGNFTDMLKKAPKDGRPVHEMMMIRSLVHDCIDSHTHEKIDIAEAHNAMTQRGLRLAATQYGVSPITDIGLLHEDADGIDPAYQIYSKLLDSETYLEEIKHTVAGTNKKRPRIVMKIGFSDFAKQHSAPGGKPSNEKCLMQTIKAIADARLAGEVDLDIEFAGGEGPGRRVNLKGYEYTLQETVTPSVLSYAAKKGVRIKYRETIQGGDGAILLGTEQSASKIMATQLDHITKHTTQTKKANLDNKYYTELRGNIQEHHQAARGAYHKLYNDADYALLMKLFKQFCEKGGSRKVNRGELKSPYEQDRGAQAPLADFRAIGFNAASIQTGVHLPPIFGQGTAFYQNMTRTEDLVQSPLFRERLMTAFMVRDLHMMEELENFIELYNPAYWHKNFAKFDENGRVTVEAQIAKRLDDLRYSDGSEKRIYPRLKSALRKIEDDLEKFDQIRQRYNFDDVEAKINEGDYQARLQKKRALLKELHQSRFKINKQAFIDLESQDLYSEYYSRDQRHHGISAGICLEYKQASGIFDPASNDNDFVGRQRVLKAHADPILDLCGNA